ncbi:unnamed protein product [Dicrocoelium dendriticum]|nr:unnamed protein product [Dicrocoelium dendriticum]
MVMYSDTELLYPGVNCLLTNQTCWLSGSTWTTSILSLGHRPSLVTRVLYVYLPSIDTSSLLTLVPRCLDFLFNLLVLGKRKAVVCACLFSILDNNTFVNQTSSLSSGSSDPPIPTSLTRPVIRFIRRSPLSSSGSSASVDQKPTSIVDPPCSVENVTELSDFSRQSGPTTDACLVTENECIPDAPCSPASTSCPSSDVSCKPSDTPPRTCTPSTSPACFTVAVPSSIPSEESVCTAPISPTRHIFPSPPTSASSISFDIARHLPPPTESFVVAAPTGPVPSVSDDNNRTPAGSKRRR